MPGIVAADTDLSAHRDSSYNVTPDFVALEGFDYLRKFRRALSGGVTTAYLSPGRNRFIAGQGSVVKLFGDDIVDRITSYNVCYTKLLRYPDMMKRKSDSKRNGKPAFWNSTL